MLTNQCSVLVQVSKAVAAIAAAQRAAHEKPEESKAGQAVRVALLIQLTHFSVLKSILIRVGAEPPL